ncbi:sugar transferase [Vibrio anguillarum]|uniref:sugar transferase n=5 Tax=Vibrio anguillarum TaxID=55601 RepID=UPI00188A1B5A|nr:sugar transferase [Vibrio anguillarum]MBF4256169.1 sugar transferase [Vibrio anguillarum]MBF4276741.1 sugar transferase [Vibrio anguillarum]MBF4297475.1 sugar transferase [Vibrio anguillarum]MBF4359236.1 sugar transferase [Vibrio anguillarum]MBF4361172.1 sugar transferase [Vibrio anguillarum]
MVKRLFDIVFASLGLAVLFPFFCIIALLIKLDSEGPVFFRQMRVGRGGVLFRIHKFRTMALNSESVGRLTVGNDSRVTRIGHFLRRYKVDELPQLIDVVVGNMSLVGPRPEVQEFIDCYPSEVKLEVLSVRPGITDLASIEMVDENEILAKYSNSRKAYIEQILPIKQQYYVDYVRNNSLFEDINIIFKTLYKIVNRN